MADNLPYNPSIAATNAAELLAINCSALSIAINGPNPISFAAFGSEILRLDYTGNIGVRNATPSNYTASGLVLGAANIATEELVFAPTAAGSGSIVWYKAGTSASRGRIKYDNASDFMSFTVADLEALRIINGNVGIGTTSPNSAKAVIKGTTAGFHLTMETASDGTLGFAMDSNGGFIGTFPGATADVLRLGTSGSARLFLDTAGNVGVGGMPANKLDVLSSADGFGFRVRQTTTGSQIEIGHFDPYSYIRSTNKALFVQTAGALPLILGVNNQQAMRITPNLRVCVNTLVESATFNVVGSATTDIMTAYMELPNKSRSGLWITKTVGATGDPWGLIRLTAGNATDKMLNILNAGGAAEVFTVDAAGNVTIAGSLVVTGNIVGKANVQAYQP
jgi:hypothetical protein